MRNIAPYRLFFPLGVLNALLAVGVWLVDGLGWLPAPAFVIHSKLVVGGFLWCFITGFLMTAVPKMTGTPGASPTELLVAGAFLAGQTGFSWLIDGRFFYSNQILLILFLAFFGGRRLFRARKSVPIFFSHIIVALALALWGAYAHASGSHLLGLHLYHIGSVLVLILGIGTRFYSFLSGLPSAFEQGASPLQRLLFHASSLTVGALLVMAGLSLPGAYLGLGIVTLGHLCLFWRVFRPSARPSALRYSVRIVALAIPASFILSWLMPSLYVAWLHILFIACFGLITLAVATRVALAHGSYPLELETKSPSLWLMVGFLLAGLVARLIYGVSSGPERMTYLHVAAVLWVLALLAWGWTYLPKVVKDGPMEKPSC